MKLLSVILSIFVLMNMIAPMPSHDCASHETQQTEKKQEEQEKNCCHHEKQNHEKQDTQNKKHSCNGECNCGCNAIISIIIQQNILSAPYYYFIANNFIYIENNSKNTYNTFWHPPKA